MPVLRKLTNGVYELVSGRGQEFRKRVGVICLSATATRLFINKVFGDGGVLNIQSRQCEYPFFNWMLSETRLKLMIVWFTAGPAIWLKKTNKFFTRKKGRINFGTFWIGLRMICRGTRAVARSKLEA